MKKKHLYIALGTGLVLVLGVIAYLGMQGDTSYEDGPPALEENTALTGTLTADGDRYFNVENADLEGDALKNFGTKSPKNFLLFTTPATDAELSGLNTVSAAMEELIVDDGLSGYVLGTYRPMDGGWHLAPEKNYLGATRMAMTEPLRACETYFVIKIDDKHTGWTGSEREEIAFNQTAFDILNGGADKCSIENRNIAQNGWNLMSVKYDGDDPDGALLDALSVFDNVYAIWDTAIINQLDRTGDSPVVVNANTPLYRNGVWETGLNEVVTAGLEANEQDYDGGKYDLWVYVGDKLPEVNEPPVLSEADARIDLTSSIKKIRDLAVKERSLEIVDKEVNSPVQLSGQPVVFASVDPEGNELVFRDVDPNFTVEGVLKSPPPDQAFDRGGDANLPPDNHAFITNTIYSPIDIFNGVSTVGKNSAGLNLFERTYGLTGEYSDGENVVIANADVTFEWANNCVAQAQAYSSHIAAMVKGMIRDRMNTVEDYADAKGTVFGMIEAEVAGNEGHLELLSQLDKSPQIVVNESDMKNPPYLTNECGSGFAACVDAYLCEQILDPNPKDVVGFGRVVEMLSVNGGDAETSSSTSSSSVDFANPDNDVSNDGSMTTSDSSTESSSTTSSDIPEECANGETTYYDESVGDQMMCPKSGDSGATYDAGTRPDTTNAEHKTTTN